MKKIPINKITFTFPERYYEKYDVLEVNGIEYVCTNRTQKLDSGEWSIEVRPFVCNPFISKFKYSTVSEFFQ